MKELIGKNVIVRTVTYHYTGKLSAMDDRWMTLDDAAWVADSGRWANALSTGELQEVEPYPGQCFVSLGAVVDVSPWSGDLPRGVK